MNEERVTGTPCPAAETLALFAEGKLKRHELPAMLAHLEGCMRCARAVRGASNELGGPAAIRPIWLAIAAAVLLAFVAVPLLRHRESSSIGDLVALSPRTAREIEPRLSGGFAWAPWREPVRSTTTANDAERMKLVGAAGELLQRAQRKPSAESHHDAGIALAVIGEPLDAVTHLREAAMHDPKNARIASDLAAALYAAGVRLGRPSLVPEALAEADRALRLDPHLPEALFNRAVILEHLALSRAAREAWQRYLEVDQTSEWAIEARRHRAALPAETGASLFRRDLPLLERAAAGGDTKLVEQLVRRYPQQARTYAEAEHLGLWGEARLSHDTATADRLITIARAIGDALKTNTGESLLRDTVRTIDDSETPDRLAAAHAFYRRGRLTYARQEPLAAEPALRRAAMLLEAEKSPMALAARYFTASARYDRNDVTGAEDELRVLSRDVDARGGALALEAQVRWQMALCRMQQDDWMGALPLVQAAESTFRKLGERSNLAFVQTLAGDALVCLSRPEEAWAERIESFGIESAEGRGNRLSVSLGGAARMELRAGRFEVARALIRLEEAADRALGDDPLLTNVLVRSAVLAIVAGDRATAGAYVKEADAVAKRIGDAALRERASIDTDFARGAVAVRHDPRGAIDSLTRAIDGYIRTGKPLFLPECYLLRARARSQAGDAAAADDVERGVALLERHRIRYAGSVVGTGIFDAGRALFAEAIRMALARNDPASAFAYAERSSTHLGGIPASVTEIRRRLRGSDTAILEIVALDDELVTFCITEGEFSTAAAPAGKREVAGLAARPDLASWTRLYDLLIRPNLHAISEARHLIVVNDPALERVAFGALYDSGTRRHLVEGVAVATAVSASSLQPARREPARSVLAMELPSGEAAGTVALPRAAHELEQVRALYPHAIAANASPASFIQLAETSADVIHLAGHTQGLGSTGETGFRFGDLDLASWRRVASARFPRHSTIVLAACETLRRLQPGQAFAMSIGAGFLAAGAGDVIGTLDLIADDDASEIFQDVHRRLAAGADADCAVRGAQLDALASGRPHAWWALAVLTRRIPSTRPEKEGKHGTSAHLLRRPLHAPVGAHFARDRTSDRSRQWIERREHQ